MFKLGAIYSYAYLWAREKEAGEESGRKDRPACLLLRPPAYPDVLILFPITSKTPRLERRHDLIPERECRNAGLTFPAWIMLDEYNVAFASSPYDFASTEPRGEFSPAYLRKLVTTVGEALAAKKVRKVVRR